MNEGGSPKRRFALKAGSVQQCKIGKSEKVEGSLIWNIRGGIYLCKIMCFIDSIQFKGWYAVFRIDGKNSMGQGNRHRMYKHFRHSKTLTKRRLSVYFEKYAFSIFEICWTEPPFRDLP